MDDVDTEGFDIANELTIQPGTSVINEVAPVWDEEEEWHLFMCYLFI